MTQPDRPPVSGERIRAMNERRVAMGLEVLDDDEARAMLAANDSFTARHSRPPVSGEPRIHKADCPLLAAGIEHDGFCPTDPQWRIRPPVSGEPTDDFEEMLAGLDRIINDTELQQQLLDAGLLVRIEDSPPPVSGEPRTEDAAVRWALAGPAPTGTQVPGIDDTISELHAANRDSNDLCDEIHPRIDHSRWQARATPPSLDAIRAAIEAEPFFPNGDGPSIGNATAFRDYRRRILARLTSKEERHD